MINKIIEICQTSYKNKRYFSCIWNVTRHCNFRCSYCNLEFVNEEFFDKEHVLKIADFCNILYSKFDLGLTLYGGEPLIHPNILDILNKLNYSVDTPLKIFTNLSSDLNFLERVIKIKNGLNIISSYHHNYTNHSEYLQTLEYLCENNIPVLVKVMLDETFKKDIINKYKEIKELENTYNTFECTIDLLYSPTSKLTKEEIEWYKKEHRTDKTKDFSVTYYNGTEDVKQLSFHQVRQLNNPKFLGQANFFGFNCDAGKRHFLILPNGDVCKCIMYKRSTPITNALNNTYEEVLEKTSNTICEKDNCYEEVGIPKKRTHLTRQIEPILCCIILTEDCNWSCPYCDRPTKNKRKGLNFDLFKTFFPKILNSYKCDIYLGGGEIGLLDDKIFEYIFSFKRKLCVCTNGTFITNGYFEKYYDLITKIVLQHATYRPQPINLNDPKIEYNVVVHHDNVQDVIKLVNSNKTKNWTLQYYHPKNPSKYKQFTLTKSDYFELIKNCSWLMDARQILRRIQTIEDTQKMLRNRKHCRKMILYPTFDFSRNKIQFCKLSTEFTKSIDLTEKNFHYFTSGVFNEFVGLDECCLVCDECCDYAEMEY